MTPIVLEEFQTIYDPAGSGFPDEATAAAWRERGARLAGRLASAQRVRIELHTARRARMFEV
ncbi:hypothetical protein ACRAKI_05135 [Saccharothrix isguenensis]